jgi:hypothetical protein
MDENNGPHGTRQYSGVSWRELIREGWAGTATVVTSSLIFAILPPVVEAIVHERPFVWLVGLTAPAWARSLDEESKRTLNLIAWGLFGFALFSLNVIFILIRKNRQLSKHINERIVPIEQIVDDLLSALVATKNPTGHLSSAAALLYWERSLRNGVLPDTMLEGMCFWCESNPIDTNGVVMWRWMDLELVESVHVPRTVNEKRTENVLKGSTIVPVEKTIPVVKHEIWKLTQKGSDVVAALKKRGVRPDLICTCGLAPKVATTKS